MVLIRQAGSVGSLEGLISFEANKRLGPKDQEQRLDLEQKHCQKLSYKTRTRRGPDLINCIRLNSQNGWKGLLNKSHSCDFISVEVLFTIITTLMGGAEHFLFLLIHLTLTIIGSKNNAADMISFYYTTLATLCLIQVQFVCISILFFVFSII